ncbi:hypothetical protein D3C80_1087180 [compost metagenome]
MTGQQIGDAGLIRARIGGAAQFGQGFVGHSVLFKAERALDASGGVQLRVLGAHLGQGRARRRLELGLLQGLADQEAVLIGGFKIERQPEIDHAELQNPLGDDLIGGGLQRQGRALAIGRSRGRAPLGQHPRARGQRHPIGRARRDGGVILRQSLVTLAAALQELAIRQTEQARGQGVAGQIAPFGVSLIITTPHFQQPGAIGARHQGADRVEICRRNRQGAIPVARRRRDPRRDIETRAPVRIADGAGLQHGVGLARIAVDEGLHRRDQTPGLNDDRRDALPFRRDPGGDIKVAGQQRGREGLFAHARLLRGQGLDPRQIVGAGLALATGQGVAARQVEAIGAASLGVSGNGAPDRRDGRGLRRRRFVGDDDFRILAFGVSRDSRVRLRGRLDLDSRLSLLRRDLDGRRLLGQRRRGRPQGDQGSGGEQGGAAEGEAHGRTLHAFPSARKRLKPLGLTCSGSWGRRRLRAWSRRCSATGP